MPSGATTSTLARLVAPPAGGARAAPAAPRTPPPWAPSCEWRPSAFLRCGGAGARDNRRQYVQHGALAQHPPRVQQAQAPARQTGVGTQHRSMAVGFKPELQLGQAQPAANRLAGGRAGADAPRLKPGHPPHPGGAACTEPPIILLFPATNANTQRSRRLPAGAPCIRPAPPIPLSAPPAACQPPRPTRHAPPPRAARPCPLSLQLHIQPALQRHGCRHQGGCSRVQLAKERKKKRNQRPAHCPRGPSLHSQLPAKPPGCTVPFLSSP